MQILESIWDMLSLGFKVIIDSIKTLIFGFEYLINFLDKFDSTLFEVEKLTSQIFPPLILSALLGVLGFYVGIRIIRFLTFQG